MSTTTYEYEVQGAYGYGWECLTTEDTKAEAMLRLAEYDANEAAPHRVRRVRAVR